MSIQNTQGTIGGADSIQADGSVKTEHVAETATYTSPDISTQEARALEVDVVMRTVGTGSITITIDRYDKASKTWINMLTGSAVITNVTNRYKVSPDLAAAANVSAQDHLPEIFRVVVTHNNANATTYSLSYHLAN